MDSVLAELRHRPLLFVDDLDRPVLDDADRHHFERVLRLDPGQPITLGDGTGRWREARFGPVPEPVGPIAIATSALPPLTLAFVPVKAQGPEWYCQKLTELGVDEIVPLVSARSVVRWDGARATRQHERMVRAAREACLQCRRLTVPTVAPPTDLARFIADRRGGPTLALADPDGGPLGPEHTVIVVGPEGGFSDDELMLAPRVTLPGNILRAETAVVVAASIMAGFRAGLVGPAPA